MNVALSTFRFRRFAGFFLAAQLFSAAGAMADSGFIGLQIQGVPPDAAAVLGLAKPEGVLVRDVAHAGPAALAGFRRGDLIVKFDGKKIDTFDQLVQAAQKIPSGKAVSVVVRRGQKTADLTLKAGAWPDAWRVTTGAFANIPEIGSTVASLTPKIRETFSVPWGSVGVVVTLVDTTKNRGLARGEIIAQVNQTDVWLPEQVVEIVGDAKRKKRPGVLMLIQNANGFFYRMVPVE